MKQGWKIGVRGSIQGVASKTGKPIVDVLHPRRRGFVVQHDAPGFIDDVAAIPPSLVAKNGHQRGLATRFKRLPDGSKLHRQKRIAVDDDETFFEYALFASQAQGSGRPKQNVAFVNVANLRNRGRLL